MTNARLFTDALAARRWHQRHGLPIPLALDEERIRTQHLSLGVKSVVDEGRTLVFLDDSTATRSSDGHWNDTTTTRSYA